MKNNIKDALDEAERIGEILERDGVQVIVIGAIALAAHQYVRFTNDVDLGVNITVSQMAHLQKVLQEQGYTTEFREPDAADPLGGVIDVTGSFGAVQIVNFGDRFPAAIQDAFASEPIRSDSNSGLQIIPIPQLVALKLYAGGWKGLADIVELLRRNPNENLEVIGETCRKYRLHGWDKVLEELREQ